MPWNARHLHRHQHVSCEHRATKHQHVSCEHRASTTSGNVTVAHVKHPWFLPNIYLRDKIGMENLGMRLSVFKIGLSLVSQTMPGQG